MNSSMVIIAFICFLGAFGCTKLMAMSELSTKQSAATLSNFKHDLLRSELRMRPHIQLAMDFVERFARIRISKLSAEEVDYLFNRAAEISEDLQRKLLIIEARAAEDESSVGDKERDDSMDAVVAIFRIHSVVEQLEARWDELRSEARIKKNA